MAGEVDEDMQAAVNSLCAAIRGRDALLAFYYREVLITSGPDALAYPGALSFTLIYYM